MTIMRDWSIDRSSAGNGARPVVEALRRMPGVVGKALAVWRERHRQRRELALFCARDFRDCRVPIDVIAREARKWPWQR